MINNIRYLQEVYNRNIQILLSLCSRYDISDSQATEFIYEIFVKIISKDLVFNDILEEESYFKMQLLKYLKNAQLVNVKEDNKYLQQIIWEKIKNNAYMESKRKILFIKIIRAVLIVLIISALSFLLTSNIVKWLF